MEQKEGTLNMLTYYAPQMCISEVFSGLILTAPLRCVTLLPYTAENTHQ